MNSQCIRLQSLELKNFKNTVYGCITMPSALNKSLFDYQSDILGVYGQNGTGKSSLIEAMDILKHLLGRYRVRKDYSRYIAKGEQQCSLQAEFLIETTRLKAKLEYSVSLQRKEEALEQHADEDKGNPVFIASERLRYAKWDEFEGKFTRITELFNFDISHPNSLTSIFLQKEVESQKQGNDIEIALAIAAAQSSLGSILVNPRLFQMLESLESLKAQDLYEIISALIVHSRYDIIVIQNDPLALAQIAMPFHIRQRQADKFAYGYVSVPLSGSELLPESDFALLKEPLFNINKVLETLIPRLQIELRHLGVEINEQGDSSVRVQLLSHRGDVVIPLQCESAGIIKIISILSALLYVFHHESVCLVVDELDAGIFEYLLGELLYTFDTHAKGQILFTSHNLRALEMLRKECLMFSTTNPENRYIRMKNVKSSNNLRDQYFRAILLGGQSEELYAETDRVETARAFRQAIQH